MYKTRTNLGLLVTQQTRAFYSYKHCFVPKVQKNKKTLNQHTSFITIHAALVQKKFWWVVVHETALALNESESFPIQIHHVLTYKDSGWPANRVDSSTLTSLLGEVNDTSTGPISGSSSSKDTHIVRNKHLCSWREKK